MQVWHENHFYIQWFGLKMQDRIQPQRRYLLIAQPPWRKRSKFLNHWTKNIGPVERPESNKMIKSKEQSSLHASVHCLPHHPRTATKWSCINSWNDWRSVSARSVGRQLYRHPKHCRWTPLCLSTPDVPRTRIVQSDQCEFPDKAGQSSIELITLPW